MTYARHHKEGLNLTDEDILSVESRRTVFGCVREHAGAHLREIARRCNTPLGTTLYHLDCLEAAGMVVARRDGRYKRYFASHGLGRREKEVLSLLRHEAPRRILGALLDLGPSTQRGLCRALGLSRSTMSFHLNRLVLEGLVTRHEARPENLYEVAEAELVRDLLHRFHQSLVATSGPARSSEPSHEPAPAQPLEVFV